MQKSLKSYFLIVAVFLMLFISLKSYALDYTITFARVNASDMVDSVIVQNLTQGTTITVPAGNDLTLNGAPNSIDQLSKDEQTVRVFPNSTRDKSIVLFFAKQSGSTLINVFGIDGKKLIGINKDLSAGENSFQLALPKGVFAVKIAGNGYSYAAKVIGQDNAKSKPEIDFPGNVASISSKISNKVQLRNSSATTTMLYTAGDRLLYKGASGNSKTIVTDVPTQSKTITFNFVDCTDADNNHYAVVQIGTQTWMVENLKTTKYRNGESIGTTYAYKNISEELAPKYQWVYNIYESYASKYGRLYTWYAVNDSRNLAPTGWHVASDAEWTTLENYLVANGNDLTKNITPGFSDIRAGYHSQFGFFENINSWGYWWSATQSNYTEAFFRTLGANKYYFLSRDPNSKSDGFSVRCVRDVNTPLVGAPTLITTSTNYIKTTSTTSGGIITSDGGSAITVSGVCWNTSPNPTTANSKTTDGTGLGRFTSSITDLTANTRYYVRAYATNSVGTSYGNDMFFTTLSEETVADIDGNVYHTVTIGTQTWLVENLKTTKYRNGESIGTTIPADKKMSNESEPKYQWAYNGDESNVSKYGRLYTWYAVNDSRKIAPTGWHVASDAEWLTLESYLIDNGYNYDGTTTDNRIAKSLAATTDWKLSSTPGYIGNDLTKNNTSGFSALPGGYRENNGTFKHINESAYWLCSTESIIGGYDEYYTVGTWTRYINNGDISLEWIGDIKESGSSVRCVRD